MVFQKSLSALSPVHRIGGQMHDVLQTTIRDLSDADRAERIEAVLTAVRPAEARAAGPIRSSFRAA